MGTFVISKKLNGDFKFNFMSKKGNIILTSQGFESKLKCEEYIELFKQSLKEIKYLKFKASREKYFFKLVFDNQELAVSRKYTTEFSMQKGIDQIMQCSSKAEILDFSNDESIFQFWFSYQSRLY